MYPVLFCFVCLCVAPASLFDGAARSAAPAELPERHVDQPLDELAESGLLLEGRRGPPQQLQQKQEHRRPLGRRAGRVEEDAIPDHFHLLLFYYKFRI